MNPIDREWFTLWLLATGIASVAVAALWIYIRLAAVVASWL